jgi:replicative DNA helicase
MKPVDKEDFLRVIERSVDEKGPMVYIWPFDEIIGGLPKRFVILGGFSGCYKTTLGLNTVYNNAVNLKYNCCFLSFEMERDELIKRLLVRHALHTKFQKYHLNITLNDLKRNPLNDLQKDFLINKVAHDLETGRYGKILIYGPCDMAECLKGFHIFISKIEQDINSPQCNSPNPYLQLLVIDYIQLLARFSREQFSGISDPYQIVAQMTRHLRHITQTYGNGRGITIIALSQLNRSSYTSIKEKLNHAKKDGRDKYKNLSDLTSISESNEIVNAADMVFTIYSDDPLKKDKRAVIQLLKNRFGETIEEGVEVLALPDVSYIGDFKQSDSSEKEEIAEFISSLLRGY